MRTAATWSRIASAWSRLTVAASAGTVDPGGACFLPEPGEVLVEHFQGDVGQERGKDPTLRGASVVLPGGLVLAEDPRLEERLDQRQDSFVSDPSTDSAHQDRVVDLVETCLDVPLENPLIRAGGEHLDFGDRVHRPPPGSEPVGGGMEVRFEDRFEYQHQAGLNNPVSNGRDPEPPVGARRFRDQPFLDR